MAAVEMTPPRFTETWRRALFSFRVAPDRAKVLGYSMSEHADWETGANCWPSQPTLAREAGISERKVARGLIDLEGLGFIQRTGIRRPRNTTDWQLAIPASLAVGGKGDDGASLAVGGKGDQIQSRHFGDSVSPLSRASLAVGGKQPQDLIRNVVTDEEEGDVSPTAIAVVAPRPTTDDVTLAVTRILPGSFAGQTVDDRDPRLATHIGDLLAGGWTVAAIREACRTLPTPTKNATGLLVKHLGRLVGKSPGTTPPVRASVAAHPLDGLDRKALAPFGRPTEVRAAVAEMIADGITVTTAEGSEIYAAGIGGTWAVEWNRDRVTGYVGGDEDDPADLATVAATIRRQFPKTTVAPNGIRVMGPSGPAAFTALVYAARDAGTTLGSLADQNESDPSDLVAPPIPIGATE